MTTVAVVLLLLFCVILICTSLVGICGGYGPVEDTVGWVIHRDIVGLFGSSAAWWVKSFPYNL